MTHTLLIWKAVRQSLEGTGYKLLFVGIALAMFFLFVLIPVWVVPGNNFAFQLSLFTPQDFILLVFLSLLNALFITMQVYAIKVAKTTAQSIGKSVGGGAGALFAGIAGTAFCASCLAPFFALFGIGFGGVIFVLEYRFYFVAGITLLMLIAIYLTVRKINRVCTSC